MSGEPLAQVQLSREEAEALAEQLAAVTLAAPPTPPTARAPEETLVGLVYDKCMELHVGPESAPTASPCQAHTLDFRMACTASCCRTLFT